MADGQNPIASVEQPPTPYLPDPSTGTAPGPYTASDVLGDIQAAQNAPPPAAASATPNLTGTQTGPPSIGPTPTPPDVTEHMSLLHRVLDKVGTILGGDETLHIKKDADGNITMTKDPSTTGEKWGRIAQAALTGAGAGFANSQGPGGPARAAAAGIQAGAKLPQQNQQLMQGEVSAEQQTQLRNAQKALVQQKIVQNAFNMKQQGVQLTDAQSDRANQIQDWILSNPTNQKLGDFKNMDDVIKYENTQGGLIQGHANGMFHTEVMGDGTVRLFSVDQAWAKQMNDKPVTIKTLVPGATADAPMQLKDNIIDAGTHTNGEIAQMQEAQTERISKYQLALAGQEDKAQTAKDTAAARAQTEADRRTYQGTMAQIAQENAETRRMMAGGMGGGAPGAAGQHGDAYLNSGAVPDSMKEQVKSIARGDAKMPTGSRSGQVQALRTWFSITTPPTPTPAMTRR